MMEPIGFQKSAQLFHIECTAVVPLEKDLVLKEQETRKTEPFHQEYCTTCANKNLLLLQPWLLEKNIVLWWGTCHV